MPTRKLILDVTCANRSIWFNKNHPNAVYCDIRQEKIEQRFGVNQSMYTIDIAPDIVCDFTDLPFDDDTFTLCVFDPPHIHGISDKSWLKKHYGILPDNWQSVISAGFSECMRVLKPEGILVFKWAETSVAAAELLKVIGTQPLFGHHSGKKMGTYWMTFMKLPNYRAKSRQTTEK
jgi:tRNA G10  N-methylase Trm11